MPSIKELHEKVLYPVVRVRTGKAGGSGVLVYSEPDPKKSGTYINVAFTCEHVVDDAIKYATEWDSVTKKDRKVDVLEEVSVETFNYDGSRVLSANAGPATIIAYNKPHDIAVVRLHDTRHMPHTAKLVSTEGIEGLQLFAPVWTSGCSLGHDPFANPGTLTYTREIIEQKSYIMANASAIFGNSGGALFHGETLELLGLTARVTNIQLGFGYDVMTWMNFAVHPERLHEFIHEQSLEFMVDPKDDYHSAMARRARRQREASRQSDEDKPREGVYDIYGQKGSSA